MAHCTQGYTHDENGNCVEDPNAGPTQQITCYDGSLADSYDKCPDIGGEWEIATGIGIDPETGELGEDIFGKDWVAPAWWDDPETLNEDERALYIFQMAGGESGTGMEFRHFWDKHEQDFPTWQESGYAAKYENVLEQLGMLNTTIRLASEEFNLNLDGLSTRTQAHMETALTQKEDIGKQMESQFIGTGGVVSGRAIEAAEAKSENINQALGLEFRGIDIEKDLLEATYKGELVNIEDKKIDYETALINIEDGYDKHLLNLIDLIDIEPLECETGEKLCPNGVTCVGETETCPREEDEEIYFQTDEEGNLIVDEEGNIIVDEEVVDCSCVDGVVTCTMTIGNSRNTISGDAVTEWFTAYATDTPTCEELTECESAGECPACDSPNDRAQCINGKCECLPAGAGY